MAAKSAAAGEIVTAPSLTLKRRLNASPEKVWAAWTDPKKIARWFGPASVKPGSERAEIDARIGGRYRVSFDVESGEHHEVDGVYRELVRGERLVFSWAWHSTPERQSLVTVTLKPDGDGTLLTLTHEQFFDQPARDGHRRGWTGALEKLENYLA